MFVFCFVLLTLVLPVFNIKWFFVFFNSTHCMCFHSLGFVQLFKTTVKEWIEELFDLYIWSEIMFKHKVIIACALINLTSKRRKDIFTYIHMHMLEYLFDFIVSFWPRLNVIWLKINRLSALQKYWFRYCRQLSAAFCILAFSI